MKMSFSKKGNALLLILFATTSFLSGQKLTNQQKDTLLSDLVSKGTYAFVRDQGIGTSMTSNLIFTFFCNHYEQQKKKKKRFNIVLNKPDLFKMHKRIVSNFKESRYIAVPAFPV